MSAAIEHLNSADPLLLPREAAHIVRLAVSTLAKKRRNGQGPRYVLLSNRRVAYRMSSLQAWLAERERTHHQPEADGPGGLPF